MQELVSRTSCKNSPWTFKSESSRKDQLHIEPKTVQHWYNEEAFDQSRIWTQIEKLFRSVWCTQTGWRKSRKNLSHVNFAPNWLKIIFFVYNWKKFRFESLKRCLMLILITYSGPQQCRCFPIRISSVNVTKPTVLSVSLHKSVTHVLMISVILSPQLPSKNIFLFSKKLWQSNLWNEIC